MSVMMLITALSFNVYAEGEAEPTYTVSIKSVTQPQIGAYNDSGISFGKTYSYSSLFSLTGATRPMSAFRNMTSTNTSVATVSGENCTIIGEGQTTMYLNFQNGTYQFNLTVSRDPIHVSSVSLNKTSVTVYGGTETLTATVLPTNADNKNLSWSSSNTSIATVDNGVVTAVSPGTAIITVTAEDGGKTAECEVTVPEKVTVTFVSNGGSNVDPQTIEAGLTAEKPDDPDYGDLYFGGWYSDEGLTQEYDFNTPVTGNITLYARWDILLLVVAYNDKMSSSGNGCGQVRIGERDFGTYDIYAIPINSETVISAQQTNIEYKFIGWSSGAQPTDGDIVSTDTAYNLSFYDVDPTAPNYIYYAHFAENDKYTVTFELNGGVFPDEYPNTQEVYVGGKATRPENDPDKYRPVSMSFIDWYADEDLTQVFDFENTVINEDTTIYAGWGFTIMSAVWNNVIDNYDSAGVCGEIRIGDEGEYTTYMTRAVVKAGDSVNIYTRAKSGYKFVGWMKGLLYPSGDILSYDEMITVTSTETILYYPLYEQAWLVSYDTTDAEGHIADEYVAYDYDYTLPGNDAFTVPDGMKFHMYEIKIGDGEPFYKNAGEHITITGDTVIKPDWAYQVYPVNVVIGAGSANMGYVGVDVESSESTSSSGYYSTPDEHKICAFAKEGYVFDYWKISTTGPMGFLTRYSDNPYVIPAYTYYENDTDNIYAEAYFRQAQPVTVTFDPGIGTMPDEDKTQTVFEGSKVIRPADPLVSGAAFAGWYKDPAFQQAYDFDTPVTAAMTLYAGYSYELTIVAYDQTEEAMNAGGTVSYLDSEGQPAQYQPMHVIEVTYGDSVTLSAAADENYIFLGWKKFDAEGYSDFISTSATDTFTVDFCGYYVAVFEKHIHDWTFTGFIYNTDEDVTKITEAYATYICNIEPTHYVNDIAADFYINEERSKAPTCTENGEDVWTVSISAGDSLDGIAHIEEEYRGFDKDALGHDWDNEAITVSWNADNSECTATRHCKRNEDHTDSETVVPVPKVTKQPTCDTWGETTYTAAFENEVFGVETLIEENIEPLGHDFGEWTVSTEPTGDSEGVEIRRCSRCDTLETRPIPKISYSVSQGNGLIWYKASGNKAVFKFIRSYKNDDAIEYFSGIQVDGVAVDESNYEYESGSVIVRLKPSYLETLSLGEHSITAIFLDANDPEATFIIRNRDKHVVPNTSSDGNVSDSGYSGAMMIGVITVLCFVVFISLKTKKKDY
ncbi:MAG: InlB B-repeat-containing protein [Erysipelotrichaceae bacterium]|nr:InlB B-repeat-containing protein [Erysipelotrichaceae bacterium]